MKEQIRTALLITTLAAGLAAHAAPVIIISDGVTNTGPITLTNSGTGALSISLDSSWSLVAAIGESKPTLGSASDPNMELAHPGSLDGLQQYSDSDFIGQ